MSEATIPVARPGPHIGNWVDAMQRSGSAFPVVAILLVLAVRTFTATGVDQSVLMTWTERFVDGARPFVDFIEINPIGSLLLYVPAVLLGRVTGLSTETSCNVLVLGLIASSLWLCWRIAKSTTALDAHDKPKLLAISIVVLGAMPAIAFAQREHIGIIALLPFLCVAVAEAENARPEFWLRMITGMLAGLSMIAKPHFALLIGGTALFTLITQRRIRAVFEIQWLAAAAVLSAYVAYTYAAFPEFYSVALPRIVDVYLGWRLGPDRMLSNSLLPMAAISAMVLIKAHKERRLAPATLLLATIGVIAIAIFFLQGRAWAYHALPAMTAAGLALAFESTRTKPELPSSLKRILLIATAAITIVTYAWCFKDHDRNLDEFASFITRIRAQPSIVAIAEDISVGHPLVRRVNGRWAQQVTHLWTAGGVIRQLMSSTPPSAERRSHLLAYLRMEIDELGSTIERERPDIVLVHTGTPERHEFNWLEWANAQPRLVKALTDYVSAGHIADVEIMKRKEFAK